MVIVDVKWVMLVWMLFCVSGWGGQMFDVALVFEDFGENINRYSGDAYF